MADYRYAHCKKWTDDWFYELDYARKVMFDYLTENSHTSQSGIYMITLTTISIELPMPKELCKEILAEFEQANKISYDGQVMWVKNMRQYQTFDSQSPKTLGSIRNDLKKIPECEVKNAYLLHYGYPTDTVSMHNECPIDAPSIEDECPIDAYPIPSVLTDVRSTDVRSTEYTSINTRHADVVVVSSKRTPLQELDRLKPGCGNSRTQQELNYLIEDHGEEKVVGYINEMLLMDMVFTSPIGFLRNMCAGKNGQSKPKTIAELGYDPSIPDNMPGGKNRPRI